MTCQSCPHPVHEHSREPGVGCLRPLPEHICRLLDLDIPTACPCTEPGDSGADQ